MSFSIKAIDIANVLYANDWYLRFKHMSTHSDAMPRHHPFIILIFTQHLRSSEVLAIFKPLLELL